MTGLMQSLVQTWPIFVPRTLQHRHQSLVTFTTLWSLFWSYRQTRTAQGRWKTPKHGYVWCLHPMDFAVNSFWIGTIFPILYTWQCVCLGHTLANQWDHMKDMGTFVIKLVFFVTNLLSIDISTNLPLPNSTIRWVYFDLDFMWFDLPNGVCLHHYITKPIISLAISPDWPHSGVDLIGID